MTNVLALIPTSIRLLWEDAIYFIANLVEQFDAKAVRAGISRTAGVQLSLWLTGAESAFRRLILIAALALTPAPHKPATRTPAPHVRSSQRSFAVFRLHGSGRPAGGRIAYASPEPRAPNHHVRFPADPILALARLPTRRPNHRHNGGPVLPRETKRHPLDRWVRLSRNDPDWRAPETDFNPLAYTVIRPRVKRLRKPPARIDSAPDWRRCYDEWEKSAPAPNLAARLDALARAAAHARALILRTARRLQSQRERTIALARAAWPAAALPRRAWRMADTLTASDDPDKTHRILFDSS